MNSIKLICFISFITTFNLTFGNGTFKEKIEVLEAKLDTTRSDSLQSGYYTNLFDLAIDSDLDLARSFLIRADGAIIEENCQCCYFTHLGNWAVYFNKKGEYKKAESELLFAIQRLENSDCGFRRLAGPYHNLGNVYRSLGELEKAVKYLTLADKYALQGGVESRHYATLINLGIIYFELQDYDRAKEYYTQAIEPTKKYGSPNELASLNLNLGNIHFTRQDYDSALVSFREATRIGEELQDSAHLPNRYINVGSAHYALGQLDSAMIYMRIGLQCAQNIDNPYREAMAIRNMANVAAARGNYVEAIGYLEKCLTYYTSVGAFPQMFRAYPLLAKYYGIQGEFAKAFEVQKHYSFLKDSVSTAQMDSKLAEQLAVFEADRLQAENDSIQRTLVISQQEGAIKDLKLSRYVFVIAGMAIITILLLILVLHVLRSRKLKEELKLAEWKHTALRARMNPHFLFNALNSIQNAILNRDKMVAYEYHAKFSELMRMVLVHSDQKSIKISEESKALKLYLDLERFRTQDGFEYQLEIDQGIDLENQGIPPMLLQPFVENAIWHGVMNRDSPGKIDIQMAISGSFLHCSIDDNGIGREAAYRLQKPGHHPVATQLTKDRLALFREQYGPRTQLHITDKTANGIAIGTRVDLSVPIKLSL